MKGSKGEVMPLGPDDVPEFQNDARPCLSDLHVRRGDLHV